jgi:hypothetical protein
LTRAASIDGAPASRRGVALWLVFCAAVALASAFAPPAAAREVLEAPRIVNGTFTQALPSVGALLMPADPHTGFTWCSGTLIGCQTFLTAAHCVCDGDGTSCQSGPGAPNPADFSVFLQNAGFFAVTSIHVEPSFAFPVGDVAVLKLATPVVGVRPSQILSTSPLPNGTIGTIVGFGKNGGSAMDYGLKRIGAVSLAACGNGISGTTSVCWDFTAPIGPPGTDSNTCNADSGGPLFVDLGSGPRIAGTTSGGQNGACTTTDHSFDANVAHYASFIEAQGGADLANATCGPYPQVGDLAAPVTAIESTMPNTVARQAHMLEVAPGTTSLRIALNGDETPGNDFDLWLRAGVKPTRNVADCRATGSGQYGYCEISNPVPGTWWATVKRTAGSGAYQLTATALHRLLPPVADFDGDGRSDVSVVDGQTGSWAAIGSTTGPGIAYTLGAPGKRPAAGDYDGDGKADVAVYEQATGTWTIRLSSTGSMTSIVLGGPKWVAAPGDYDGDGKSDVAVYRRSTGSWMVLGSTAGPGSFAGPGGPGTVPVPGDYDGDGKTDFAIYDPALGRLSYVGSSSGPGVLTGVGGPGFQAVCGDFDGDGVSDFAVYAAGAFDVRASSTGAISHVVVGGSDDIAAPADYDGDGITDLAVFTPQTGSWTILSSLSGGTIHATLGDSASYPVARRFAGG